MNFSSSYPQLSPVVVVRKKIFFISMPLHGGPNTYVQLYVFFLCHHRDHLPRFLIDNHFIKCGLGKKCFFSWDFRLTTKSIATRFFLSLARCCLLNVCVCMCICGMPHDCKLIFSLLAKAEVDFFFKYISGFWLTYDIIFCKYFGELKHFIVNFMIFGRKWRNYFEIYKQFFLKILNTFTKKLQYLISHEQTFMKPWNQRIKFMNKSRNYVKCKFIHNFIKFY